MVGNNGGRWGPENAIVAQSLLTYHRAVHGGTSTSLVQARRFGPVGSIQQFCSKWSQIRCFHCFDPMGAKQTVRAKFVDVPPCTGVRQQVLRDNAVLRSPFSTIVSSTLLISLELHAPVDLPVTHVSKYFITEMTNFKLAFANCRWTLRPQNLREKKT